MKSPDRVASDRKMQWVVVATITAAAGCVVADVALPLGIASGVLFVLPVLLSGFNGKPWFVVTTALLAGSLIGFCLYLSPPGTGEFEYVLVNRAISLLAVASTTWLLLKQVARERVLERMLAVQQFSGQVRQAMEMTNRESEVFGVTVRALKRTLPAAAGEVLIADNSVAHLRRLVSTESASPGCPVVDPAECPALRRAAPVIFSSVDNLDACPKLLERGGCRSAMCLPVNIGGSALGVIHAYSPRENAFQRGVGESLDSIARSLGSRLGFLRTLASTQRQAETDALTELLNRRSFLDQAANVIRNCEGPHLLALCDLDHFKRLNDNAGHAAGDQALRLFASVLRRSTRPGDILGRYGGEEFAVLLKSCSLDGGRASLERLHGNLSKATQAYGGQPFTTSIGLASCPAEGDQMEDLIRIADRCLYAAKKMGRDRCVTSNDIPADYDPFAAESNPSTQALSSGTADSPERRGSQRRTSIGPVQVESIDRNETAHGTTRDLSEGGVLFDTRLRLAPGETVSLRWLSEEWTQSQQRSGTVVRASSAGHNLEPKSYSVAVQFD